ncbi:hypothetical protein VTL71DRAFT_8015 [Oculimacula yallundae]|uniref:Uncharacterized protein n=1 Tax=Oculimacula yallundae TaxID=86028 RepID=A0ABR4CXC4_9HELO
MAVGYVTIVRECTEDGQAVLAGLMIDLLQRLEYGVSSGECDGILRGVWSYSVLRGSTEFNRRDESEQACVIGQLVPRTDAAMFRGKVRYR